MLTKKKKKKEGRWEDTTLGGWRNEKIEEVAWHSLIISILWCVRLPKQQKWDKQTNETMLKTAVLFFRYPTNSLSGQTLFS